jgi:tubulin-specific chaperone A
LKKEQEAIDKLKIGISSPKSSNEDIVSFKKQLTDRLLIQANYNATLISTNQTRDLKIGTLNEKYLEKSFQKEQEAHNKSITLLKTKQNLELSGITTLEQAKAILKGRISDKELREITTLEQAKKVIKDKNLNDEYDLEIKNLNSVIAKYTDAINNSGKEGFTLLTEEEKDKFNKAVDDASLKVLGLKVLQNETPAKPDAPNTGVDILGTDTGQWANSFKDLDTFDGKMVAAKQSVAGLQNAFGMYFKFTEAGDARALQSFTNATNKKKTALSDQLAKGYITQELYNARNAKLDQELAKKKAEIEYKQAKRQKIMSAASVLTNTAMSIMNIWGHSPDPTGISQGVLTAIVSSLGAIQLATVLAQPLPDKNGFYDGGYTGSGNERSSPGPVHYDEYVVPKKVLFSNDPIVPNIVSYLEAKRTGKQPANQDTSSSSGSSSTTSSGSSQDNSATLLLLGRAVDVLDKLEKDGFHGWIVNDIPTAKKLRDKIKELTNLESKAKV